MAGGPLDKKKLRKAWAHVAAESGERAKAFALVERGRFVAANAALTDLLGADPTGLAWDELFTTRLPDGSGSGSAYLAGGQVLSLWSDASGLGLALAFAESEPGETKSSEPQGSDWGRFALELARCTSGPEVDAACRAFGPRLAGIMGFVAVPSMSAGEVVVRCYWPASAAPATDLAFDASTCDALRSGETSKLCRHCTGLVCTPVFVEGELACVVASSNSSADAELFAKLVGAALARLG